FEYVSRGLLGTASLGLKTIAPLAGFHFSQEGVDGKAAVDLFEVAVATGGRTADISRRTLERYNADACVAARGVRGWLGRGAPGVSRVVCAGKRPQEDDGARSWIFAKERGP